MFETDYDYNSNGNGTDYESSEQKQRSIMPNKLTRMIQQQMKQKQGPTSHMKAIQAFTQKFTKPGSQMRSISPKMIIQEGGSITLQNNNGVF